MYAKTAFFLASSSGLYLWLVLAPPGTLGVIGLCALLALALAGIGFNVMHDGGHEAYSRFKIINRLSAHCTDLLGTSSYRWHWKHNRLHHTYTNIAGADSDISMWPLGRLAPSDRRLWFHRFQHFYMWLLYGFLVLKMHWWDDFHDLGRGRIGSVRIPRPTGWSLVSTIASKVWLVAVALVVPLLLRPFWSALGCYVLVTFFLGLILSVVFQLAHCVEGLRFSHVNGDGPDLEPEWSEHQIQATADFSPRSTLLTWYLGGLNFQCVHHLFPRICHVNYRHLRPLVEQVCKERSIPYKVFPGFPSAIASHYRYLRAMGRPDPALAA